MIFIVSRTSTQNKPCKEAIKRKFEHWDTRTYSEKEFNKKFSQREGIWKSKGKNHKIDNDGYITRQEEDRELWSIEINSFDELMQFIKRYESIIIQKYSFNEEDYEIEIYDSWRE
jgi:hypothetical protein